MEFVTTDTHAHAEVCADFCTHSLEHFQAKLHPALKTTAPFVRTLVDTRAPELVDHVLMHGRQFDAVQATFFGPTGCLRVIANHPPDFLRLDGLAGSTVHGFTNTRRRHQGRPVETVPTRATAHVGNLNHDLGAVLVHGISKILKMRDDPVSRQVYRGPPFLRAIDGDHRRSTTDGQA
ncbi:hypothetical protein D3C72_1591120 [compost metagenome]